MVVKMTHFRVSRTGCSVTTEPMSHQKHERSDGLAQFNPTVKSYYILHNSEKL